MMKNIFKRLLVTPLLGLTILAMGCATKGNLVSDSDNPGMTKLIYTVNINSPKSKSWKILADFSNLDWTATVTDAHYINEKRAGVGMARHCNLSNDGYIVERITQWNEGSGFTYAIDDASDPISNDSYAVWRINGDDKQSKVTFEVNYKLKYGVLGDLMNITVARNKFSNQIIAFMNELKTHAEKQS